MELIRSFAKLGKDDVLLAGGKGASLGEMMQVGIPVPPGFVILSTAFEKFLEETDLNVEIDSILHSVNHKEIHTIENASEKIKALILGAEMPKDIAEIIQKSFKNLNSKYLAVRSSATAEDSASAAWAGQLESYLNTTKGNLLENVKKCWASLFTPRAIFYRFEKNLHKQKISVAVVVQKMIESEKSGIAFSVHPVTQDRNQLIIEAGFGLGEAIVSGQITPDSYVVEKQPRQVIDKNVQVQSRGFYRAKDGGNEWHAITKEQGEKQVLSDTEILELSEIILKIEKHYDFPVDVEWAFEKERFYIVQSRPITTLDSLDQKKFIRIFKKFFTRNVPLSLIEYWHKGEYEILQRVLQGATHFNPLFIRDEQGKVNVYYDINNDDTALQPLVNFVLKNPKEFFHLADRYETNHSKFLELIKKPHPDLDEIFNLLLELWGFMPVLVQIGELENSALDRRVIRRASELRTKSQEKDAQVEKNFRSVVKNNFPKYYEFWDVLRVSEVTNNKFPAIDELKKRKQGFIFFEQNLILDKNQSDFEKEFSVKLDDNIQIIGQNQQSGNLILEKSITRDWPLFIVEMLHAGFTKEFQKQMGFRYPEVLFDIYADHLDIYRAPVEHMEKMRAFILSKLADDPKFVSKCSQSLFKYYENFLEIVNAVDKNDLSKLSNKELAELLKKFIDAHTKLEPTFVINFWFPIQMENHPLSEKWRDAIAIAAKTRAATEKVGPEGDKIATKLAQEVSRRMFNDEKYARFISLKEAGAFLLNGKLPDKEEIEKRMSGFVFGAMGIKFMSIQEYAATEGYKVRTPLRHIVTRKYGLLTSNLFIQGLANPQNYKKLLLIDSFVSSGVIFDRWCFGPQIKDLGEKLLAQEEKQSGFVDKVFSNVYEFGEKLLKYSQEIKSKNLSRLDNKELVEIFSDFTEQYKTFSVALAGWGLQLPVEAQLRARLKDRPNLDDDLAILSSPIKQNIINIEQEELLKIGVEVQKLKEPLNSFEELSENIKNRTVKHAEKFGWMTRGGLDEPWKPQEVFERLRDIIKENCKQKLDDISEHRKQTQEKSTQLLNELLADKKLKRLVEIAKELVYYRTYRTDYLNLIMFNARPLLVEIGRRIGNFGFPEIFYFRPQEIISWRKVDRAEIEQRMKNFIIVAIEPNNVIFSSEPARIKELETEYLEQEKIDSKEIKGNVAFPGKIIGRVAIVLSKKDLPKVERGDIIVSTMTTPDYIVAMEKAAAFVTNEGGITCHAAIVAREMKKPCIIGTKIATTLLKDGDKIEVDATAGVVRILK